MFPRALEALTWHSPEGNGPCPLGAVGLIGSPDRPHTPRALVFSSGKWTWGSDHMGCYETPKHTGVLGTWEPQYTCLAQRSTQSGHRASATRPPCPPSSSSGKGTISGPCREHGSEPKCLQHLPFLTQGAQSQFNSGFLCFFVFNFDRCLSYF